MYYLDLTKRDVLLDSKFNHIKDVEIKQTTCKMTTLENQQQSGTLR